MLSLVDLIISKLNSSTMTYIIKGKYTLYITHLQYMKVTALSFHNKHSESIKSLNSPHKFGRGVTDAKIDQSRIFANTNPYIKFQVNISKDTWEKSGKPSRQTPSGLTDRQMDRLTARWLGNLKSPPNIKSASQVTRSYDGKVKKNTNL